MKEQRVQEKMVEMIKQVPVELVRQVSISVPKVRGRAARAHTILYTSIAFIIPAC